MDRYVIVHMDMAHGTTVYGVADGADRCTEMLREAYAHYRKCYGGWQQATVRAYGVQPDGRIQHNAATVYRHYEEF